MIDELEKKYEGHFFRWDRYHIENYLLDSLAIAAVLEDDPDLRNLPPAGDIPSLIKQLADNAKSEVVALRMQAQLNNRFRTRINLDLQGDTIRGLQTSLTRRKQQLESALEDGRLEEEFNELSRQVDAVWAEGWQSLCVGRRVLKEFHRQVLQGQLGYEMFRNRVARKIHTLNRVPVRVSEVLEAVSR